MGDPWPSPRRPPWPRGPAAAGRPGRRPGLGARHQPRQASPAARQPARGARQPARPRLKGNRMAAAPPIPPSAGGSMTGPVSYLSERRLVALACRMLAMEGLAETTLGHVSLRVDDTHFLVRGRRASEHGLLFTTA